MGDMFRRHPEYFVADQDSAFRRVASGCCAYNDVFLLNQFLVDKHFNDYIYYSSINEVVNYLNFRISEDFRETGMCRVHIGKTLKGYGSCGVILKKGNIHTKSINQGYVFLVVVE